MPLKTAAAFGAARISANTPPPGHLRGLANVAVSTLGVTEAPLQWFQPAFL